MYRNLKQFAVLDYVTANICVVIHRKWWTRQVKDNTRAV